MNKERLPSVRELLKPSGATYRLDSFMGALRDQASRLPKAVRFAVAAAALTAACSSQGRVENRHETGLPDAGITAPAVPDAGTGPEPDDDDGGPDGGPPDDDEADGGADGGSDGGDAGTPPPPLDTDEDGIPNDQEPQGCETVPCLAAEGCSVLPDGRMTGNHSDDDSDGWCKARDNSPAYNPTQTDSDLDGVGNVTDNCGGANPATVDSDGDGRPDRQVDADGDGHGVCAAAGSDCDDNDPAIPGLEVCDDADNDCDGIVDPDCECEPGDTRTTGSDVGACVAAEETCMDDGPGVSHWETTSGATGPVAETSRVPACNGVDDDCDGAVDNGVPNCECVPGVTAPRDCGSDVGNCETGTQVCQADGTWSDCTGQVEPAENDPCNGDDDDCDGATDEDYDVDAPCVGRGECGVGDDGTGEKECNATHDGTLCSVNPGGSADRSSQEIANGSDDDCNGRVDDAQFSVVGGTPGQTARMGDACHMAGVCGDGTYERAGDFAVQCNAVGRRGALNPGNLEGTADGLCDGADNDCDSATDEGCGCDVGETHACGTSTGACNPGVQACVDGEFEEDCGGPDFTGPSPEVLNNGVDDDCNGLVDDKNGNVRGAACNTGVGRCDVAGVWEFNGEIGAAADLRCSTDVDGSDSRAVTEVCNVDAAGLGIDDDCDGEVNECDVAAGIDCGGGWPGSGNPGLDCNPGGVCGAGQVICDPNNNLRTKCSTASLATSETCNDLDDDCDGATDEGCINECSDGTTQVCGDTDGVCGLQRGLQTCQAANDSWSNCVGDRRPGTETCNGDDDDCNGVVDNGFAGLGVACNGVGDCGPGTIICKPDGTGTNCSTNPGMPGYDGSAEQCNGADDDCDGVMDEGMTDFSGRDLGKVGDACPLPGECVRESVVCDGAFHTRCSTVGRGGVVTERCDGLDNDCDGATDETFDVNAACSVACPDGSTLDGIRQCTANMLGTACSVQLADCP